MTLKKGDLVVLMQRVDENWFIGEVSASGQQGFLPANFVEVNLVYYLKITSNQCILYVFVHTCNVSRNVKITSCINIVYIIFR